MKGRLIVRPEAEADLAESHRWYEERRAGLGDELLGAVDHSFSVIEDSPERFPVVYRDVRRVLTKRFPFAIYYVVRREVACVIAVLHQAHDPARLQGRL